MATLEMTLTADLLALIETRLNLVDRVLLDARVSRIERNCIVQELEGQVLEQLERRTTHPQRGDVLAVLAELDPPEAYVPEAARSVEHSTAAHVASADTPSASDRQEAPSAMTLGAGLLAGVFSLMPLVSLPVFYWWFEDYMPGLWVGMQVLAFLGAILGLVSLLRPKPTKTFSLQRLVEAGAVATAPLTMVLAAGMGWETTEEFLIGAVAFLGGHGLWLSSATVWLWVSSLAETPSLRSAE